MVNHLTWRTAGKATRPRRRVDGGFRAHFELLEDRRVMSADAVLDWNAVALDAVKNDYDVGAHPDQGGPGRTARALAIVHVAMYDALMSVDRTYAPIMFFGPAIPGTSVHAAVSQAAHDTLVALFPQQIPMFEVALKTSLAGIPALSAKLGVRLGGQVAQEVLAARANDGADGPMDYTPGTLPGQYRPDPLHPDQMIIGPDWNMVKGLVIESGAQFPAPPPPAMTSQDYTDAYNYVKAIGADGIIHPTTRTADQTQIGIYWAYDGVADIGTPPRLYNQMARVIAEQQHNTEAENARMFAILNVAMHDVGVVLWTTKYEENFWRPITAIRESDPGTGPSGLGDGNPDTIGDPTWTPLGSPASNGSGTNFTPGFPAYTSGHAGFGAAVFTALRDFYGTNDIAFTFTSDELNGATLDADGSVRPLAPRSFSTLSEAAEENAVSRVYLGVHWQFDVDQAMIQGRHVADYVFTHFPKRTMMHHPMFHIEQFVDAFGIAVHNIVTSVRDAIDQVLSTNVFHNGNAAPPAPALTFDLDALAKSVAGSRPAATSKAPPVSLAFVNGPAESFERPATSAKLPNGLASSFLPRR